MAVDAVWRELKAVSAALRSAKNKTERGNAVAQVQQFLSDDHHRRLVHKWRAWGLLLSNLLHVVKTDAQAYLNGPSTTSASASASARSRKRGALVSSPPADSKRRRKSNAPRLEYWAYLRNEFASLHALDDPVLHLDPNGRECVHQLFEFAVVVIGREADGDEDATIAARLEDEAWRTIELIVPFRVYCAVVPAAHLQDVLELALASLEHGNTIGLASRAALRASIVHKLLPHCLFDLQDLLPRLLEFFSDWFSRVGSGSDSGFVSAQSVDDVAPLFLAAATDLVKAQATAAGLPLLLHGVPILHYIQRVWKATKFRPRGHMTEFILTFLDQLGRHAPEVLLRGTAQSPVLVLSDHVQLDATLLRRTLKALVAMLLSPKDVQSLLLNAKVSGSAAGSSVLGSGASSASSSSATSASVGAALDAEPPIASYVRCAADVIYHHDRLVAALLEHESTSAETSDGAAVGSKRTRPVSTTLAWESLLEILVLSADGRERTGVQKQHVTWLLLLLAVLTRHGAYYVVNRIGDVMAAVDALSHVLEAKELDQRQYVALSVLVQLSHLAAQHSDACSDLLDDRWQRVYRQLLRIDLPYADATESAVLNNDAAGAVVLHLLTNAIAFRLVPQWLVAETQAQLVQLPVFQSARVALASAPRAASGSHSSVSAAPVRLLTALLQCVELHESSSDGVSSELALPQLPLAADNREGNEPHSLRARLLATLFTHVEIQVTAAPSSFPGTAYAIALLAFLAPSTPPRAFYSGSRLASNLLLSVAQRTESVVPTNRTLDGFGVHFTCHEDGLATLFQSPDTDASGPHRFSETIETYLSESALTSPYHSKSAPPSSSASHHETFRELAPPMALLAKLLPGSSASVFDFALPLTQQSLGDAPSIARVTQAAMHSAVAAHFARLVATFSATLRSVSSNARVLTQSLVSLTQVATVLACLYTELPRPATATGDASNSLDVAHLLERVLALVADHMTTGGFAAAQLDATTAAHVTEVLTRFHSLVLILQGKRALATCAHPCAEPMDLRFPPELRQPIRKIVGAVEAGLTLLATGDSSSASASQTTGASVLAGSSSSSDWTASTSSSQVHASMPPAHSEVLFRDALDDSSAHDRSVVTRPRPRALKTINLWCFRVLLLLKKDSGLKSISDVAQDVQFSPDFVLALATLLCGVAGTDSLDLLLKLLDYAAEEASRGASRQSNASVRLALFQSQVFGVLKLAGRMHERRKLELKDDIPDALMQYTQAFAAATAASRDGATELRVLRQAELECLEVYFRLDLDAFGGYVDIAMARMLDADWRVRYAAVRGVHSMFYMYPDGGQQVFKDLCHCLRPILPATCAASENDESLPARQDGKGARETGSIEICATVALALYMCACSSEDVVPDVLVVFLRLASSDTPLYASCASTFLHSWLGAIATAFAYPTPRRLLDDHFCYVWSQFIAIRMHSSDDASDASPSRARARELLEQFPMALFTGATTDSSSRRFAPSVAAVFADKVDILLPVGVLYDALDETTAPDAFPFLHELVAVLTPAAGLSDTGGDSDAEKQREQEERRARCLGMAVTEQLTTDLFALSFVLQASRDASLQDIASRMLAVAEAKAATSALSIAHLGHVVCKIARFTVWDLARVSDEPSDAALWLDAIAHMKHKYSGFDWTRMHVGELLCEFDALLLATERSGALAARAVHCFDQFVTEVADALTSNFVLQQLVLRIAFSALKQLGGHGKAIARRLTLCVRQLCAHFMDTPDLFGKYVSFVVHEIAGILARSRPESGGDLKAPLALDEDDKGHLEWVVFAVCNNMANGLGKSILDIDAVPVGVSSSLDKLSALIAGSRDVAASDDSSSSTKKASAVLSTGAASVRRAGRQIDVFVKRAQDVGGKFYQQSRLIQSSGPSSGAGVSGRRSAPSPKTPLSTSLLRLATVEASVGALDDALDDAEQRERAAHVVGTLTKTLFYLSARECASSSCDQESDVLVALANALSAVGALDPHTVDLSPGADATSLSRLYHEQFHRGALRETKTSFLATMYERVLVYLASLLFDDRTLAPETVEQAVVALKRVLSLREGGVALSKCKDSDLREFLSPFVSSPPANWSASMLFSDARGARSRSAVVTQQQHAQLWRSGSSLGYDQWVRSMTSYLATEATDPVLRACASLVAVRTEMAVFLFPYVLWSVLQPTGSTKDGGDSSPGASSSTASSAVASVVESGVRDVLKRAARSSTDSALDPAETDGQDDSETSSEPLEIVQLLVHSVTFLREIEKAAFVESNGRVVASASAASESSDKRASTPTSRASASSQSQQLNQRAYGCGINVDLLDVALAAIRVKMPYSAMQYVEMWLEETHGGSLPSLAASSSTTTAARAHMTDLDEYARQILVRAYSFDHNVDEIYGINDGRTLASQLVTYKQEGSYLKALPIYDVSLQVQAAPARASSSSRTQLLEGMFHSLRQLGFQHLLQGYLASLPPSASASEQLDEHKFELAWKNLQWDTPGTALPSASHERLDVAPYCHQKVLFQSLKALAHRDSDHLAALLRTSKGAILTSVQLGLRGLESTRDAYTALLWLESIRDIEEAARAVASSADAQCSTSASGEPETSSIALSRAPDDGAASVTALCEQWQRRYARIAHDFDAIDSLVALQQVLVTLTSAPQTHALLARMHLAHAAFSRKASRVAVAYSALAKLEALDRQGDLAALESAQWKMERAKLLWTQHETRSAIWTAKLLCSELEQTLAATARGAPQARAAVDRASLELLHVAVLTTTGKWIASQRSENSQVILEAYFQRATDLVDAMDATVIAQRVGDAAKAHLALADYMADMYHQVHTRVTSREWLAGKRVAEARHRELDECNAMPEDKRLANRAHIHALKKEVMFDNEERAKVEDSVAQFLAGALRSFGKGLALSPSAELAVVFRLLSLWFSNQRASETNAAIDDVIDAVPSYKFVPLSYQIMSRIGSARAASGHQSARRGFQQVLRKLVLKLCLQHPHHALVQLLALKNNGDVEGKGAAEFRANVGDAKADDAKTVVDELRTTEQRELLESLDILSTAYIQLALFDTREYHSKGGGKKIALAKVPIVGLHAASGSGSHAHQAIGFDQCLRDRTRRGSANRTVMPAVLTCHVAPRADMDYSSVVRVLSFEPLFSITDSGIHRPKIIYCYGSNGRRFKQLVKGKDDTRQDLVIEQAFETVNHFLQHDKATRARHLRLRTYKVVPLSPIAGVLEWVDNTVPWGSYLVGRTAKRLSAHERYHPHEWKHVDCRTKLKNATDKRAAYAAIEAHFTPVFHHFFLEKFPDPAMWYHRRLAYVQSAAVTSIVGYILGIGDRHSQNILVHEETAELVHIDFGVVFDQGMALFTPETVPFRLTRDMVDGMGVAGVDGVFTRCCEATLQLLRKKRASVVTILEVFVHDPLYRWTLSPLKALKIQEERGGVGVGVGATGATGVLGRRHAHHARTSSHHSAVVASSDSSTNDATHASVTATSAMDDPSASSSSSSSNNDAAARALLRVKQKLDGYEDPNGNALSIEGQVKQLISAAQDPHNLCNLFPGWAPWL